MTDSKRKRKKNQSHHTTPHFFKPLLPDFHINFPIPISFLKHLEGDNDYDHHKEKIASLKDKREKIWEVKIDVDHQGNKFFKDGWEIFCKEHGLEVGDFLVFGHLGNLVFDVVIYDPSGCEREFPHIDPPTTNEVMKLPSRSTSPLSTCLPKYEKVIEGSKKNLGRKAKVAFKPRGHPYFHAILRPYSIKWSGMPIPAQFARENGLAKRSCEILVINEEAKSWVMPLRHHKRQHGSAYIGSWCRFYKDNALNTGDLVIFELLSSGKKSVIKFYKLS